MQSSAIDSTSSSVITQPVFNCEAFHLLADYFEGKEGDRRWLNFSARDKAISFLRNFAGILLRLPSMEDVERLARNHHIAETLNRDPDPKKVTHLEDRYGLPKRNIAKSFSKTTGGGLKKARARALDCKLSGMK